MSDQLFPRLNRATLRDQVYATVLDAIVSGRLAPGVRVRDQELAAELGISRTPVREALRRLEDEGLVQTVPGALTRVAPLDIRDAREAVPVIAALHAVATREATSRLTGRDLETLAGINDRFALALDEGRRVDALADDDAFHQVFVDLAGNGELARTLERLMPRVRRLELARFGSLAGRASVRQHHAILEVAARGDGVDAARLVEDNWLGLGRLLARTFHTDPDAARELTMQPAGKTPGARAGEPEPEPPLARGEGAAVVVPAGAAVASGRLETTARSPAPSAPGIEPATAALPPMVAAADALPVHPETTSASLPAGKAANATRSPVVDAAEPADRASPAGSHDIPRGEPSAALN